MKLIKEDNVMFDELEEVTEKPTSLLAEYAIKHKAKLIKLSVIFIVILVAVSAIFIKGYTNAKDKYLAEIADLEAEIAILNDRIQQYENASREVNVAVISSNIQGIGELATIENDYTDVMEYEDVKKVFKVKLGFTKASLLVKWEGIIKAGIDLAQVELKEDKAAKVITVILPQAKILSHEVIDESIEVLEQKNGLFNKLKVQDYIDASTITHDHMEQRAIENGLLDKAIENAKPLLTGIINTGAVKEAGYTIQFEIAK